MTGLVPNPTKLLEEMSRFFRLLSKPARLALLCQLHDKSLDVATLTERTGFSQPHPSRQLSRLERAGLVTLERQGNHFPGADVPLIGDLCTLDLMAAARMVGGTARADEWLILNLPNLSESFITAFASRCQP